MYPSHSQCHILLHVVFSQENIVHPLRGRSEIGGSEDLVVLGMFCIFISNRWGIQHGWGLRSVWAAEHRGTKQFSPQWPTAHCAQGHLHLAVM